ncbi:aminotransferase class V-fold PLP-dependent enzyme [Streptomyces sp. ISL-11]|uniref:aminotransferase class V-fold PLP-dependent enzyme n=1 Tax=Streptomyces sp. ISL-11 TaxID=2819174 RepID=UPI001BE5381E|nr:aminotransferase class V-fold PLP-dependent enzyme [Streptomyces sp. ISL-11]MBT2385930.1 aminotransferase class V-fold PLP-dependent enzyme [Streptomyces sp. ISL-11]
MESLARTHFAPENTYLNTASAGLFPAAAVTALTSAVTAAAAGAAGNVDYFPDVEAVRSAYGRLLGVSGDRVAVGGSVAVYCGLIAASLPAGAEVLVVGGDFSSLVNPFHMRPDLRVRTVPLEKAADGVRHGTALVAVSAVQSADGRIADLDAIGAAARAHGARTLVDVSQAAGWLPFDAAAYDYTVCVGYKWLMCPRGAAFLTVPEDFGGLTPVFAGWAAGEDPWESCYGRVETLAPTARRFDENVAALSYVAARHSLALVEELGVERIGAHDRALADRFRAGLAELGHTPVRAEGSAIVSVPGLGSAAERLTAAGVRVGARAGNLRAAFHLYNTSADVDRLLEVLAKG